MFGKCGVGSIGFEIVVVFVWVCFVVKYDGYVFDMVGYVFFFV